MRQQILVTLLQAVEAGTGAQDRKVGRPDMCRDEQHLGTDLQADLQQIAAIQIQDRPAIGGQIADGSQAPVELVDGGQRRQADDVMHLPRATVLPVDRTDLDTQQKTHLPSAGRGHLLFDVVEQIRPQAVQALFGRDEVVAQPTMLGG